MTMLVHTDIYSFLGILVRNKTIRHKKLTIIPSERKQLKDSKRIKIHASKGHTAPLHYIHSPAHSPA